MGFASKILICHRSNFSVNYSVDTMALSKEQRVLLKNIADAYGFDKNVFVDHQPLTCETLLAQLELVDWWRQKVRVQEALAPVVAFMCSGPAPASEMFFLTVLAQLSRHWWDPSVRKIQVYFVDSCYGESRDDAIRVVNHVAALAVEYINVDLLEICEFRFFDAVEDLTRECRGEEIDVLAGFNPGFCVADWDVSKLREKSDRLRAARAAVLRMCAPGALSFASIDNPCCTHRIDIGLDWMIK